MTSTGIVTAASWRRCSACAALGGGGRCWACRAMFDPTLGALRIWRPGIEGPTSDNGGCLRKSGISTRRWKSCISLSANCPVVDGDHEAARPIRSPGRIVGETKAARRLLRTMWNLSSCDDLRANRRSTHICAGLGAGSRNRPGSCPRRGRGSEADARSLALQRPPPGIPRFAGDGVGCKSRIGGTGMRCSVNQSFTDRSSHSGGRRRFGATRAAQN